MQGVVQQTWLRGSRRRRCWLRSCRHCSQWRAQRACLMRPMSSAWVCQPVSLRCTSHLPQRYVTFAVLGNEPPLSKMVRAMYSLHPA